MKILRDYNLSKLNTFGIPVSAKFFAEINDESELKNLFSSDEFEENKKMFLGAGSNVLFIKDFDGIVILNKLKGIEIIREDSQSVTMRAFSGEIWHDLVRFAVERGYWGIENLSLIPGTVGGALVENLGAYGAELSDVFGNAEAYRIKDGTKKVFKKEECNFSYHDSIFKNKLKGQYFILSMDIKLSKVAKKNTSYRAFLLEYLQNNKKDFHSSKDISDAVVFMRTSKLPDPKIIPNAGSFFRNVFLEKEKLQELLAIYPNMPHYKEGGLMKVPAGWLVEQAGWKGYREDNIGVHEKHALVLVNHGGATGAEIQDLAEKIIISVKEKFGLELTPEVNIV